MRASLAATMAASLLLSAGCLSLGPEANQQTLDFDFNNPSHNTGWIAGTADVPTARLADVGLVGEVRAVPATLGTGDALYLAGTNVTGDLFNFLSLHLIGLPANRTYTVLLQLAFLSDQQAGCNSGPGPFTVIKAGVTIPEPLATEDGQGVLRMNVDKGAGTSPGQYTNLGDIRNSLTGCPTPGNWSFKETQRIQQSAQMTTDASGGFYVYLGTQSSFVGRNEIYFTNLRITLR